ncbi:cation antiporter [Oscillochloris trichoides DG-6]|uniref:Cation antiporter n=1 Tax=Oscillochloris trichoides DG-6 TaxID=765420 RepID=E1IAP7_9CHLR|nr:Na+/H+ antiporter subunit E [Oscillochloris trichoides]EFO81726.1 cation antiporter [Oscillochloris trichoides DG-6]
MLVLNLLLAIIWLVLQTSFTWADFVVGMLVGFGIIGMTEATLTWQRPFSDQQAKRGYVGRVMKVISFSGFVIWAIIKSNLDVAWLVLNPRAAYQPGIVAVPLDIQSDLGITLLANVITLTPGTVSLDISSDRRTLYIHAMNVQDPDALRAEIKGEFERRVMEIFP